MTNGWGGTQVKLEEVEGIGPAFAKRLREAGVRSIKGLLEKGMDPKGRKAIAGSVRTSPKQVLAWVNRADLFRVKGVGEQYSDLLEKAGVDTVVELAQRQPQSLYTALVKVNESKNLVNKLPTEKQVKDWVRYAKTLKRVVEY
jgi:predicted flap endonuclease-1-like 5' DNA nuclease